MSVWIAVIRELTEFAVTALGIRSSDTFSPSAIHEQHHHNQPHKSLLIDAKSNSIGVDMQEQHVESVFRSAATVLAERTYTPPQAVATLGAGMVAMTKEHVAIYGAPAIAFDSAISHLAPGVMVRVDETSGRWCSIAFQEQRGWVLMESLAEHEAEVLPFFVLREYCGPEAENTLRVRTLIDDVFGAGAAELPLRGEEFVVYALAQKGLTLPEVSDRPRLAGNWHKIFKGKSGVHIAIKPKTGSVMEWSDEEGVGKLAYIQAVAPDDTVMITMVGEPEDGYYCETSYDRETWQALSPVFIQFT